MRISSHAGRPDEATADSGRHQVQPRPVLTVVGAAAGDDGRQVGEASWFSLRSISLMTIVVLPTLLAAIYCFGMAADRYTTEARFVIRTPGSALSSQLTGLFQGSSISKSVDDAYIVNAYITSRDATQALVEEVNLLELLGRPRLDILWRYPGPFSAPNREKLHRHLQSFIRVQFDNVSGIGTLAVQAFEPEDARAIAQGLLRNAERLINRLSERGNSDAIELALREVEQSRTAAVAAQSKLTEYRTRNAVVDPGRVSASAQTTISRLALEKAQTSAYLSELERSTAQSPQVEVMRVRISALDRQIHAERQALAGADQSLAPLIAEYERLMLEREFAERMFGSALVALETARSDAQRQRLFLEQVSAPGLPDYAASPYRFLSVVAVFLIGWAIHSLVVRLAEDAASHDSV